MVLDINTAYLGATLLAWGNSVGDMVANVGISKRGLAQMAIVGCFAGPLFNMCVGLGISMTRTNIIAMKNGEPAPEWDITKKEFLIANVIIYPLILMLIF